MNHNYVKVIGCLIISFSGYVQSFSQTNGPEFLQCSDTLVSLCVQDEGVRLPANNQVYLGEGHPDATSCSVHISMTKQVTGGCGSQLYYNVALFLNDTGSAIVLQPETLVSLDSTGKAGLSFDTEQSPDSLIQRAGIPYQHECNMYHRIVWTVVDSCGQVNSCLSKVHVYDCSKPAAVIPSSFYVVHIPSGCQITLHAVDYDAGGVDDCSLRDQLTYSFEPDTFRPIQTVVCPEAFGVELTWKIWIADEGEDVNCDGQIEWSEKNKTEQPFQIVFTESGNCDCGMNIDYFIAGEVRTENMDGIKNVEVEFSTPGQVYPTSITDADGKYFFPNIVVNGEATISAYRNDFHKNGVSTLDLVMIQKHLLGKDTLNSPYKYIAADANNSQHVSAIDLIELRKLILGIYTELPQNLSWRFVPADYIFQEPFDPWTDTINPWTQNEGGTITITDPEHPGNLDFIGIKIGDVNGTVQPDLNQLLPRESKEPIMLLADQKSFNIGDIISVPLRITSDQMLTGFQFTLAANDMEIIGLLPGAISIGQEDYALFHDRMTVSWFDEDNVDLKVGDVLFTIQLRAHEAGDLRHALSINSSITEAELYVDGEQTYAPELRIDQPGGMDELTILSCSPNPWKDETTISYYLPMADKVTYTLTDVNGKRLTSFSENVSAGYQSLILKSSDFAAHGMIFLEIRAGQYAAVQKMIVQD